MDKFRNVFSFVLVLLAMTAGLADSANAQRRSERDVRDAVRSLSSKLDDFEQNLRYQMQSSSAANVQIGAVSDDIRELRDSVRRFEENLDRRRENKSDVAILVDSARRIESFMQANTQNRRVIDDWNGVKRQLERIGSNYGITIDWSEEVPLNVSDNRDPVQKNTFNVGLSGTYELDAARSESIDDIVSDTSLGNEQREDLKDKLTAPQEIAIDIRGNQVTLATTTAPPMTFTADGRDKTERDADGRNVRLRATLSGDTLTVSSVGGETDHNIKFTSVGGGRTMKVTRRITTAYLNETKTAESVYAKTDSVAKLGIGTGATTGNDPAGGYSDNDQTGNIPNGGSSTSASATVRPGNYIVPNGTIINGYLETEINTKISQNNDRFRLTVQSPDEFRGATVEGYISGVGNSGRVSGNSNVTFNFERITLRGGQSYDFAGNLNGIKNEQGKTVRIDNEGTAKGDNQTRETAKRGGIGAGLGAIIGAIAGGGKGAAIGAVIGGGAGAGTVIVQGKDGIRLMPGSMITVQSSSPSGYTPR